MDNSNNVSWDKEVDLLVAGAGPGGMTVALVAALEGLNVLICEKSEQVGGTGATSAGTLWIPGNTQSKLVGFQDATADAEMYLDGLIGNDDDKERRQVYLDSGPNVIDYLTERSDVKFSACGKHPDYRNNVSGAAIEGRAIVAEVFDGRKLGADFVRVRPPIEEFMLFDGMMVAKEDVQILLRRYKSIKSFLRSSSIFIRYLIDRLKYRRGTRLTMGNALVARLFYSLRQQEVPILFGSPLIELVLEDNHVKGAILENEKGREFILARRGIVFATGGFAHNKEFRDNLMPKPTPPYSMASDLNTGDGLKIAKSLGAKIDDPPHKRSAFWSPVSITKRKDGSNGLFPHILLDRAKPGLIAVNSAGNRFVNEACSYHDFVEAMYRSNEVVDTIPAWLICDATFVFKYGIGAIHPGTKNLKRFSDLGYIKTSNTVKGLAKILMIDESNLEKTINRSNEFAATGIDVDFGKGDLELNRFNGDADNHPNPCLACI